MLSRSVAMSLYIIPRATRDFDFIIHLLPKDVDLFAENFKEGYYFDKDAGLSAVRNHSMFNVIDHKSGFKADFVILKNNAFRQAEFNRRVQMDYYGKTIHVVTAEDLTYFQTYLDTGFTISYSNERYIKSYCTR